MRIVTGILILLHISTAVEITICDCSKSKKNGFIKVKKEPCNLQNLMEPEPAYYKITSYRDQKARFTGFVCSIFSTGVTTTMHIDTTESEKKTDFHVRPRLTGCLLMAGITEPGIHKCPNGQVMTKTNNKWTARNVPPRSSQFLRTKSVLDETCLFEQTTLQKDCSNCQISSIFGKIENYDQVERKNGTVWIATPIPEGTLMFKEQDTIIEKCTEKIIEDGEGFLYKMNNDTFRLSNPKKQLDLIISKTAKYENDCNVTLTDDHYWVLEMPGIIVTLITPEKDHEAPSNPLLTTQNSNNRPVRDLKDDIDVTGHLTFIQNRITHNENKLANSINLLLCESMRNRIAESIQTARSNGWLAAKLLGFPTCTRLVPVGQTALLETCAANQMNVSAEVTNCGPQVKVGENSTVNINGFELTKFANCYSTNNLVNLNGYPYTYREGDWERIEETIIPMQTGFIDKYAYNADNSLKKFVHMDADNVNVIDHIAVLADIVAIINEHEADVTSGNSHASSALILGHEKENHSLLQNIATWIKYIGGISFASAGVFLVFKLLGGQSILQKMWDCFGLPSWAGNLLSGKFLSMCENKGAQENNDKQKYASIPFTVIEMEPTKSKSLNKQTKRHKGRKDKNKRCSRTRNLQSV